MCVDLARSVLACPGRSRSRSFRIARSLARFSNARGFNQDLSRWVVSNVNKAGNCAYFCANAGFNPISKIPKFPTSCGTTGC